MHVPFKPVAVRVHSITTFGMLANDPVMGLRGEKLRESLLATFQLLRFDQFLTRGTDLATTSQ